MSRARLAAVIAALGLLCLGADYSGRIWSSPISKVTKTVVFSGGGGDASKTTSGLMPDGLFFFGITTKVTTAATGYTSIDIGVSGGDLDMFAAAAGITLGDTTDNKTNTANWSNPQLTANEVTITAVGGNCVDLAMSITVWYLDILVGN